MKAIITEIYVRLFTKEEHLTSAECKLYFSKFYLFNKTLFIYMIVPKKLCFIDK